MTLEEVKKKILSLIEELNPESEYLTDDPDIQAKINYVINQVQYELARMKKIPELIVKEIQKDEVLKLKTLKDFYQLDMIIATNKDDKNVEYDLRNDIVVFKEDVKAKIYYFKYPTKIDENTDKEFKFELDSDVCEILPYGVAGDLLKSDVSSNYGTIYSQRYETMLQRLDSRQNLGSIYIDSSGLEWI